MMILKYFCFKLSCFSYSIEYPLHILSCYLKEYMTFVCVTKQCITVIPNELDVAPPLMFVLYKCTHLNTVVR